MFDNYAVIAHKHESQVFLIASKGIWTLPRNQYQEAPEINCAMKEQFSIDVTTLGCIYDRYKDEERDDQHQVYALENHSPDWEPSVNGRWVSREVLATLTLAVPEHRTVLETWFALAESENIPAGRLPWARNGLTKILCRHG